MIMGLFSNVFDFAVSRFRHVQEDIGVHRLANGIYQARWPEDFAGYRGDNHHIFHRTPIL